MDRFNGNPELDIPPDLTDEQIDKARAIVKANFGSTFDVVGHLPRNVGVVGDKGMWGETLLITASDQEALKLLYQDHDKQEQISTKLTNALLPLTRVVIDIAAHSDEEILIMPPGVDFTPTVDGE